MNRITIVGCCLFMALITFYFLGCASGPSGKLIEVENPTEYELRQNWNEYTVYYRRNLALIYKIKIDSKIELDVSWIEVTSENMMKDTRILGSASVKEIIDKNDKLVGYLVHRSRGHAWAGIVDENTVKISYWQYNR